MPPAPRVQEGIGCAHERSHDSCLLVVMVVITPIMVPVPPAALHVPPPVVISPAALPCHPEFMPPVIRLPAVVSMMLDSLVELAIRECRAPLAIPIIRICAGRSRK